MFSAGMNARRKWEFEEIKKSCDGLYSCAQKQRLITERHTESYQDLFHDELLNHSSVQPCLLFISGTNATELVKGTSHLKMFSVFKGFKHSPSTIFALIFMDITRTQNIRKKTLPRKDSEEEFELNGEGEWTMNVMASFCQDSRFNAATLYQREVLNIFAKGKKSPCTHAQQKLCGCFFILWIFYGRVTQLCSPFTWG